MARAACERRLPSLSSYWLMGSACEHRLQARIMPPRFRLIVYMTPSIPVAHSPWCDRDHVARYLRLEKEELAAERFWGVSETAEVRGSQNSCPGSTATAATTLKGSSLELRAWLESQHCEKIRRNILVAFVSSDPGSQFRRLGISLWAQMQRLHDLLKGTLGWPLAADQTGVSKKIIGPALRHLDLG